MKQKITRLTFSALALGILAASQGVMAHSNTTTRTVLEGTTNYNNISIGHGCVDNGVIANSVVFPDGTDSTVTVKDADGNETVGVLSDYVSGVPAIRHVMSNDAFQNNQPVLGRDGVTVVGIHSWKGLVPAHNTIGLVPFRTGGVSIVADSCATSARFDLAVADVCKITKIAGFATEGNVNFWTPYVDGSNFNRADGRNEAGALIISRNTVTNPLPEADANGNACGAGVTVRITPSAAQMNHDLPIPLVWPKAR